MPLLFQQPPTNHENKQTKFPTSIIGQSFTGWRMLLAKLLSFFKLSKQQNKKKAEEILLLNKLRNFQPEPEGLPGSPYDIRNHLEQNEFVDITNNQEYILLPVQDYQPVQRPTVYAIKIETFNDLTHILQLLRTKRSVIFIDITDYLNKHEALHQMIRKLKHTRDAINGDLVGIGASWIAATTSGITVERKILQEPAAQPHPGLKKPHLLLKKTLENYRKYNLFWGSKMK